MFECKAGYCIKNDLPDKCTIADVEGIVDCRYCTYARRVDESADKVQKEE